MRWPWVSAHWRDAYQDERAEVRRLTDVIVRLERVREGLPETPIERKPKVVIPAKLDERIDEMWAGSHNVTATRRKAVKLYDQHEDWSVVEGLLFQPAQEVEI